ncbi:hypothetical protein ES707_22196 [subsurface metagenome]
MEGRVSGEQGISKSEARISKSSAVLRTPYGGHLTVETNPNLRMFQIKKKNIIEKAATLRIVSRLDSRSFDPFGHAQGRLCSGQVSRE